MHQDVYILAQFKKLNLVQCVYSIFTVNFLTLRKADGFYFVHFLDPFSAPLVAL